MNEGLKRCSKCSHIRERYYFSKDRTRPDGLAAWCKKCRREYEKSWHEKNDDTPEQVAKRAAYYASPGRQAQIRTRTQSPKAKATNRRWRLKRYWGLTPEMFDAMLAEQNGGCAVCQTMVPGGKGTFHVDHCHETGRVRGLLCAHCNTALGKFKDSVELLIAAISYLESHRDEIHTTEI